MKNLAIASYLPFLLLFFFSFTTLDSTQEAPQTSPVGVIVDYAGTGSLTGYLECDGTTYANADYPNLFSEIGYTWGGNNVDSFRVPDLSAKSSIGKSANYSVGDSGGTSVLFLSQNQLPSYTIPLHTEVEGWVKLFINEEDPNQTEGKSPHTLGNTDSPMVYNNAGYETTGEDSYHIGGLEDSLYVHDTLTAGGTGSPINIRNPYAAVKKLIKY